MAQADTERERPLTKTPAGLQRTSMILTAGRFYGAAIPISLLADNLSNSMDRPVVDLTELQGYYNFDLKWTPQEVGPSGADTGFASAIQDQLGLRLQKRKLPVDVMVVDRVNRIPADN